MKRVIFLKAPDGTIGSAIAVGFHPGDPTLGQIRDVVETARSGEAWLVALSAAPDITVEVA